MSREKRPRIRSIMMRSGSFVAAVSLWGSVAWSARASAAGVGRVARRRDLAGSEGSRASIPGPPWWTSARRPTPTRPCPCHAAAPRAPLRYAPVPRAYPANRPAHARWAASRDSSARTARSNAGAARLRWTRRRDPNGPRTGGPWPDMAGRPLHGRMTRSRTEPGILPPASRWMSRTRPAANASAVRWRSGLVHNHF